MRGLEREQRLARGGRLADAVDQRESVGSQRQDLVADGLEAWIEVAGDQDVALRVLALRRPRERRGGERAALLSTHEAEAAAEADGDVGATVAVDVADAGDVGEGVERSEGDRGGLGLDRALVGVGD